MRAGRASIVIFVVTAVVIGSLLVTRPAPRKTLPARPLASVQVERLVARDLSPVVERVGILGARRVARLRFEVRGRVVQRVAEAGMPVAAGAVLARIDERDHRDAVAEARARLQQERAAIARDRRLLTLAIRHTRLQQREVERLTRLRRARQVAPSRLDAARARLLQLQAEQARLQYGVDTASARLALRRTALARAQRSLERCVLRAPFAGIVDSVDIEVGDMAGGERVAVTLADREALEASLAVPSGIAAVLRRGQTLTVLLDGRRLAATVTALQPLPDRQTFTHRLRVRLPAGSGRPGQAVRVLLPLPLRKAAINIPAAALVIDEGRRYVMRVVNGVVRRVPVVTGPRIGDRIVIENGLAAGDLIVSRDAAGLTDGQRVAVGNPDTPAQ